MFKRIAISLFALLLGCSAAPEAPLLLGTNIWPGYEPLYLARGMDFFNDRQIRLVEYSNASEVIRNFRNDAIQAAAVTLDEALLLHDHIPDLRIILALDYSNGADALLAQPGINSISDLRGRRVGVENTALGAYMLSLALESAGLRSSDVQLVPLTVDEHETAYENQTVAAVVTFEPVRGKLLAAHAKQLFGSSQIPGKIIDVLVTREKYLAAHSKHFDLLFDSWFKAVDYAHQNAADFARRSMAREKTSAAEFIAALQGLRLLDRQQNLALFNPQQPGIAAQVESLSRFLLQRNLIQSAAAGNIIWLQRSAPQ